MISVIIRTYNEERLIGALLDGVASQTDTGKVEVILVDSGSTDQTVPIAREHGARVVEISKDAFSFGRSCNVGCAQARGEFAVFVSGHCVPASEDWLKNLVAPFEDPKVAVSYGRQLPGLTTRFSEGRVFEKYFPETGKNEQFPFFSNNANCAIRLHLWDRFPYDEALTGLEDMAFAKQCFEGGYQVHYSPEAAVYHIHDETWRQVFRRYEREAFAIKEIIPHMRLSYRDALFYTLVAVGADLFKLGRRAWRPKALLSVLLYRSCQFFGGARGHKIQDHHAESDKLRYYYPV